MKQRTLNRISWALISCVPIGAMITLLTMFHTVWGALGTGLMLFGFLGIQLLGKRVTDKSRSKYDQNSWKP